MKQERVAAQISDGQLNLIFEPDKLDRMNKAARVKALLTLAQILMQAAGLLVEELGDARH